MSYVNLIYVANVYSFCLRTNKNSSVGEFDESIMSQLLVLFYIIFKFILFRFNMFLFPFRTILLQLRKLFYFRNKYLKRLSLAAKEWRIGVDSYQKYEDLIQNILCKEFEDLVPKYSIGAPLFCPFAAFISSTSCIF